MVYLKLDELDAFFALSRWWSREHFNWASFYRKDFLSPHIPDLASAVKQQILAHTGQHFEGDIYLLTHVRYLGYCFNPVSFYYCFEQERLAYIVAEINNTPWNERFCYVLPCQTSKPAHSFQFDKQFHVSPFLPMNMQYHWQLATPGKQLSVGMKNLCDGTEMFSARLELQRQEATGTNLNRMLRRFPAVTMKTTAAIYWQAFRLWYKRTPFYHHPSSSEVKADAIFDTQQNHADQRH